MKRLTVQNFLNVSAFAVLVLAVLAMQSCATAKLPTYVTTAISSIGTDLPRLMGQANLDYNPTFGNQAQE